MIGSWFSVLLYNDAQFATCCQEPMSIADLIPPMIAIPAGPFLMGTPERELSALAQAYGGTRESYREESPQHALALPAFAIGRTPVTNALYAEFTAASGARAPIAWRGPLPPERLLAHPVTDVSWDEANEFCYWLNNLRLPLGPDGSAARFRLPSEAEWERAARGTDGRTFPWGSTWKVDLANTRESGLASTTAVASYTAGASPDGCLDMAGNVWQWTASLDALYPYAPADGREDMRAPGRRILRGGCYANPHGFARSACRFRLLPKVRNEFLGFRLAM